MGILTTLGAVALQQEIANTEADVAEAFGMDVALYSQAVASYIADEGTGVPTGTFTSYDWLKDSSCGGSAPDGYLPCTWNPRLPFNIRLETEVVHGTGVPTDPCPEPVGHVCAETRLTVPTTNGQERLELAAEMLHATQGSSNSVRSTTQEFVMNAVGQIQVTARGEQSPPTQYLRRDGMNTMEGDLQMGGHNLVGVLDITASGELEGARFIDRDDPSFRVDPNARSVLNNLRTQGDFDAQGGGDINDQATFNDGADIEADSTFAGEATLHDLARFIGGETDFNGIVNSTGSDAVEFTEADSQNVTNFNDVLEIVGTGVIGGACDATQENMRFNSAGELMECVSAQWQYAGIDTRKGTLTYYSLGATNSYGEFFWAGDGVDIPGRHHTCSAQSIESSNLAEGGGARVESTSGADSLGRRSFQYLASGGVEDSESIPLRLLPGERSVICLALGPEPVQATVSTVTNTAPSGSVSCAGGMTGEPFRSRLSTSDRDDPLLYRWSASGACSLVHANETSAWIQRSTSSGTCRVEVEVTDYYNMTGTVRNSCRVEAPGCATVSGACGSGLGRCSSGTRDNFDNPGPEPAPPSWDPDVDGPWTPPPPPPATWWCVGSCGGDLDFCTEGDGATPVTGNCSGTINRCSAGNARGLSVNRGLDRTRYTWTCRGINGGSSDSCEVIHNHPRPCNPATDRVNGSCGTALNTCTAGNPDPAGARSWVCRGVCGGTDAPCANPGGGVTNGVCGATLNNCAAGSFQSVSGPTWNCLGDDPDPAVTSDDALGCAVIENGVCGSSQGACLQGTPSGNTNPWTCQGSNGGSNAQCQLAECGAAGNTCDAGNYVNVTGSHLWRCMGNINGQTYDDVTCESGLCGPTQGACDQGTASGSTNPWTCAGSHADPAVTQDDDTGCAVGVCGTADDPVNGCTQGTWEDVPDTPTDVLWRCLGGYHDATVTTDDADCTLGLAICGAAQGSCAQGAPTGTGNPWSCTGSDGTAITCRVGECAFHRAGACAVGDSSDAAGNSNPWTCEGDDPVSSLDDETCQIGVCGTADNATNGCTAGTWEDVSDLPGTPPTVRWRCAGLHGGETADDTDCTQRDGACISTPPRVTGDCDAGVSNDPSGMTNPWVCAGTGGGADATCTVGVCGPADSAADGCLAGAWRTAADHTWTCRGNVRDDHCTGTVGQCNTVDGEDNSLKGCTAGDWADVADPPGALKTWHCLGNHPDINMTSDDDRNCQLVVPDGQCGYSAVGDCDAGTRDGQGNDWWCRGPDDTTDTDDDNCRIGLCPTTSGANGTCPVGTAAFLNGAATYTDGDDWTCEGSSATRTTDDVTCEPVVDGVCGNLNNATDGCESGTYDPQPDDTWNCLGINNGTDDLGCIEEDPQGVCGTVEDPAADACARGTYDDFDNGGPDWHCRGNNDLVETDDDLNCGGSAWTCGCMPWGQAPAAPGETLLHVWQNNGNGLEYTGRFYQQSAFASHAECEQWVNANLCPIVEDGACGTADNITDGCTSGRYQDDTGAGWTCKGVGGGTDVTCPACGPAPTGGNHPVNNPYTVCVVNALVRNWQSCMGMPLTEIPTSCPTLPQVCGADDDPATGCLTGTYSDVPGPSWACNNAVNLVSGGVTITNALCPAP